MSYHFSKTVDMPIDRADAAARDALQKNGFGVLTEIDVQQTMKKKLDVDIYPYRILGACNPKMAYEALQAEDKIGTMLPCNVILQERQPGRTEISAVDPIASMQAIDNPKLGEIAAAVQAMLKKVVADIGA
jgi:uncharacterized protein (DUF302 family)